MKLKHFFFCLLFIAAEMTYGQNVLSPFETFAENQRDLFTTAYNNRDTQAYEKLLTEFLSKYNKLSAEEKRNFMGYQWDAYYNFACTYSLVNDKPMALKYLRKSTDAGYLGYANIQQDSDLTNIRNEKEYKEIMNWMQTVGDYPFILRKGASYNLSDNRPLPAFTYQNSDNSNLVNLRKGLRLDSIAGQGNDILQILNLLHWIHNLIPHDGNHENPAVKNAMSMIAECKRDNRGLNCRGLATVLNECYLSVGIKSRIVTCLPKDSLKMDQDCHVINMVYAESLKKWLWIDPTFNAYVMNEKGELLGIEEVRERIINEQAVILNPDANWNNMNQQTKEYYLFNYMAKNLYILECPVVSQYDTETRQSGKTYEYIQLLPLDYYSQSPQTKEDINKKENLTWITYKTNNPATFWQKP